MVDLRFENHGTIVLIRPLTDAGQEWMDEKVMTEQMWGNATVAEPRFAQDIADGAAYDGLGVEIA